jgi:hypothetical protein
MSDVSPPQAGWYQDPENTAGERWWNGSGWSDQKRASTAVAPVADTTGFRFGGPDPSPGSRPDPYAPPPTYSAPQAYAPPPAYTPPQAYSPPSPYVAPYGAPAYGSRTNGLAVAGLIVSAGGWIFAGVLASITGIILSAFGLARAKQAEAAGNPNSGRGIAIAGIVIGIVVTVLGTLFLVFYIGLILSMGSSL